MKTRNAVMAGLAVCILLAMAVTPIHIRGSAREEASDDACQNRARLLVTTLKWAESECNVRIHSMKELAKFIESTADPHRIASESDDFKCSCDRSRDPFSYELVPASLDDARDSKFKPLLRETHPNHHGRRVIVFEDGHVELVQG
jgi:hypothetical protein